MTQSPECYRTPFEILNDLGITDPQDIDVEAIAEDCGATIRYRLLSGCAARIMGYNNRAIITIDDHTPRPRQRFSAGHELGHWMRDRGRVSFQCTNSTFVREWSAENPETRANRFTSDLLLPPRMFRPRAKGLPVTFESVRQLAETFTTSLTATAIRLIEYGELPIGSTAALYPVYLRGGAFLAERKGREAAAEFQKIIDHGGIVVNYPIGTLAYLQLGRAYALSGDTNKAKTTYQRFFTLWKDADPDIPVLKQAKAEYAKLK